MSKDPFKYFRIEARELLAGLGQGALDLDKGVATKDLYAKLLRLAHTLKGAARVVKQPAMATDAHAMEEVLAPFREGGTRLPPERVAELLKLIDRAMAQLDSLGAAPPSPPATVPSAPPAREAVPAPAPAAGAVPAPAPAAAAVPVPAPAAAAHTSSAARVETVRVDLAEMDALLASIAEASSHITGLRHELALLGHTRRLAQALAVQLAAARDGGGEVAGGGHRPRALVEELRGSLERLDRLIPMVVDRAERDLTQVREQADRVRLLPASTLFAGLERAVRDAAQTLGKQVHFHASGGELRLDGHVLAGLNEALLHVVRNAVAHGIEPEPQRRAAGKPPAGRVTVEVTVRGRAVHITCSDDGGGLDLPGIRRAAIARGALPPDAPPLDHKRAVTMLLGGGLTTRAHVDDVAGRAVGLDVLREVAARLNGHVDIRSQPGRGTTVELAVARSLHAQTVLLVQTGGAVVSLPLRAIETTLRVPAAELVRAGDTECIGFRDHLIPFAPLGRVLGREGGSGAGTGRGNGIRRGPRTWSALVVRAPGGALVALGVDGLLGTANVVAWPVPELAAADPVVAAASLDAQGNPQLVLDPAQLAARARASAADIVEEAPPAHRDPVLIIDDSLTTRMLEQSILESAGYTVELATSAEEGMTLARQRPYSLFLVDVEMPGMNGFEFVERTRADPVLGKIPAILVTSLAAPEHLRRGKEAGAAGHVAKGEFDQGALLQSIKELVG